MQIQRISRAKLTAELQIIAGNQRSQAAAMVLEPGSYTGGPENSHPNSDQWLFVLEGSGRVTVEDTVIEVGEGHLILIEFEVCNPLFHSSFCPLSTAIQPSSTSQ